MHRGFAKLYRKFLEWEWYDDIPAKNVYLHCLLKANHKDKKYRGAIVKRGTFLTGREELAKQTGLTVRQVRTALQKLNGDYLTSRTTSRGTVISIIDFDTYNGDDSKSDQQNDQQATSKRPATDQRPTTTKNVKNNKNEKNEKNKDIAYAKSLELNWLDNDIWKEWIDYKVKKKLAITERALKKNIKKLETFGVFQAKEIIETSIDNNWTDFYEPKSQQKQYSTVVNRDHWGNPIPSNESAAERQRRQAKETIARAREGE